MKEYALFELFFDIAHPTAPTLNKNLKIIGPFANSDRELCSEICEPRTITRVARLAFPDHKDETIDSRKNNSAISSKMENTEILSRHDLYFHAFRPSHHLFSMRLTDQNVRVYAHVLRYLPMHKDFTTRIDVGRRGERAMIVFTRAGGAQRFFDSVTKTLMSFKMHSISLPACIIHNASPEKSFLYELHNRYNKLYAAYDVSEYQSICNEQKTVVPQVPTKLQMRGLEFFNRNDRKFTDDTNDDEESAKKRGQNVDGEEFSNSNSGDMFSFNLPQSLQLGFNSESFRGQLEYIESPILPLLRRIGPHLMIRLLSAFLCEFRIVFVSVDISSLSECVCGSLSMLAQGLLLWRHALVPVLPPHLFKHLSAKRPFIVGVLRKYIGDPEFMKNLIHGTLLVDLDKKTFRKYKVVNPEMNIPDLLCTDTYSNNTVKHKKTASCKSSPDILLKDLSAALTYHRLKWDLNDDISGQPQYPPESLSSTATASTEKKGGLLRSLFGGKRKKDNSHDVKVNSDSEEENHDNVASLIANMVRGDSSSSNVKDEKKDEDFLKDCTLDDTKADESLYSSLFEDKEGEERVRVSLVCFYLELYGDMEMYFSCSPLPSASQEIFNSKLKNGGNLHVDLGKYLSRKKQMGIEEDSAMFRLISIFSKSCMFQKYTKIRIAEKECRSNVLPQHTPLFCKCEKLLRKERKDFTIETIREVVSTTVKESARHLTLDEYERVREQALALTSENKLNETNAKVVKVLLQECRACDLSLKQVINVVFMRIDKPFHTTSQPKEILLALNLLRTLLLQGPVMVIAEVILGFFHKVRKLKNYTTKNEEMKRTIQIAAKDMYSLMVDLQKLFLCRREAFAKSRSSISNHSACGNVGWSNYIIRRVSKSPSIQFHNLHELMRPNEYIVPVFRVIGERHGGNQGQTTHIVSHATPSTKSFPYEVYTNGTTKNHHEFGKRLPISQSVDTVEYKNHNYYHRGKKQLEEEQSSSSSYRNVYRK